VSTFVEASALPRLATCGCGQVLWSDDCEDLLALAAEHVRLVHPELVGTLSPLELARPVEALETELAA
jgi:hypothetical protein